MTRATPLLTLLLLLVGAPSARAEEPATLYERALERFSAADFEGSLGLLEQVRDAPAAGTGLRARALLYIGVNQAVMRKEAAARESFRAALTTDPSVELDPDQFKPSIVTMFRNERRLTLGRLDVSTGKPGAEVALGGVKAGVTPLRRHVVPGRIRVQVRRPGEAGGEWAHDEVVKVEAGQTLRLALRLPGEPPPPSPRPREEAPRRVFTWIAGGVGLAALATGAALAALADADHDEWEQVRQERKDQQRWADLRQAGEDKALAANILFGMGGAAAAAAVALFFLEPGWSAPGGEASVRLTPAVGRAVGVGLQGTFR